MEVRRSGQIGNMLRKGKGAVHAGRYPSKMSRRKCRGKNVADKMSRITMSLIYNVADKNVADKNVAVKNVADKNVVDIFPATFSPYWEPYDSSL